MSKRVKAIQKEMTKNKEAQDQLEFKIGDVNGSLVQISQLIKEMAS